MTVGNRFIRAAVAFVAAMAAAALAFVVATLSIGVLLMLVVFHFEADPPIGTGLLVVPLALILAPIALIAGLVLCEAIYGRLSPARYEEDRNPNVEASANHGV